MDHPSLWKLIDGLRKLQKGRDVYYEQLVAGQRPVLKLHKYVLVDQRILRIVGSYNDRNMIEYLRGLAHNFIINS